MFQLLSIIFNASMFRFDVVVACLLHVTEFRGPTHRQSGESRSAVL